MRLIKVTWKWKLGLVLLTLALTFTLTRQFWIFRIGQSLVCTESVSHGDIILVENLDREYIPFERAAALQREGAAARVVVLVQVSYELDRANDVAIATAELMARVAQINAPEIMPIRLVEPISLNAAYEVRDFLTREHLRTVIVVVSGFRSKRSSLIYDQVMASAQITTSCVPVFLGSTPRTWSHTWHGVQEVAEQFLKLQYYRFYVLWKPRRSAPMLSRNRTR